MTFLLDTNIVSELRRGARANAGVVEWFDKRSPDELCLSVVTIGEIRQGIEQLRTAGDRTGSLVDGARAVL